MSNDCAQLISMKMLFYQTLFCYSWIIGTTTRFRKWCFGKIGINIKTRFLVVSSSIATTLRSDISEFDDLSAGYYAWIIFAIFSKFNARVVLFSWDDSRNVRSLGAIQWLGFNLEADGIFSVKGVITLNFTIVYVMIPPSIYRESLCFPVKGCYSP